MRTLYFIFLLSIATVMSYSVSAQFTQRVANTTLQLPLEVPANETYDYQAVNAFPGLSFVNPVSMTTPPGETNRLFITERAGRIYVITNLAVPTKSLFMDLSARIDSSSTEEGLLGIAFHPYTQAATGR